MFDTPAPNAIAGGLSQQTPTGPEAPLPMGASSPQGRKPKKKPEGFGSTFLGAGAYTPTPASVPGKSLLGQ